MGNSHERRKERRLAERVAGILNPIQPKKPIDAWLQLMGTAVGIGFWLWPDKTPTSVGIALGLMLLCFIHPVWNFWWIEDKRSRRVVALIVLCTLLVGYGALAWPRRVPPPSPIIQVSVSLRSLGIDVQAGSEVYIITIHNDFTVNGQILSAGNKSTRWPIGWERAAAKHEYDFMDQFEITNAGSVGAFNLTLKLLASFIDNGSPNKVVQTKTQDVFVESVLPGNPFKFYVVNQSDFLVRLTPVYTVTLQIQGEQTKLAIRIDRTGDTYERFLPALLGLPPTFLIWKGDAIIGNKP